MIFSFLVILQVLQCAFLLITFFQCFLAIFQILKCVFIIFHIFQVFHQITGTNLGISHISRFKLFLTTIQIIQCVFHILQVFQVFRQNLGPTLCISHISRISVFLTTIHILHFPGPAVCFSFCTFFHISRHIQVLPWFSQFPRLSVFSTFSRSYICVSHFACFWVFLAIFLVLPGVFRILLLCQFSCHIPVPTVCMSNFPRFSCFSQKSRSYFVYFSYFTIITVSHHNQDPTVYVFHFARFSVFFAIFHVLPCEFLIFLIFFRVSYHISCPTSFASFLAIL